MNIFKFILLQSLRHRNTDHANNPTTHQAQTIQLNLFDF